MKLGFSSLACPEWDLETIISQAAAMGYSGVELHGVRGESHLPVVPALARGPEAVAARFAEASVELVCLTTDNRLETPDRRRLEAEKAQVRAVLELAGRLRCPNVCVTCGSQPRGETKETTLVRIADALRELAPTAAENGTTLLLENGGDFNSTRDLWFLIDIVNHPSVRCCWNAGNSRLAGERPTITVPRIGRMIELVHMVDLRVAPDGRVEGYALPGEGGLDVERALDLLRGVLYGGYVVFSWPKSRVAALAPPEEALPAALASMKAMLERLANVKELSAYKGDKNAPRYGPAPHGAVKS